MNFSPDITSKFVFSHPISTENNSEVINLTEKGETLDKRELKYLFKFLYSSLKITGYPSLALCAQTGKKYLRYDINTGKITEGQFQLNILLNPVPFIKEGNKGHREFVSQILVLTNVAEQIAILAAALGLITYTDAAMVIGINRVVKVSRHTLAIIHAMTLVKKVQEDKGSPKANFWLWTIVKGGGKAIVLTGKVFDFFDGYRQVLSMATGMMTVLKRRQVEVFGLKKPEVEKLECSSTMGKTTASAVRTTRNTYSQTHQFFILLAIMALACQFFNKCYG